MKLFQPRTVEKVNMKKLATLGALVAISAPSFAAFDVAPITAAQTDALAVVAALTTLGIAVWGANYVRRKFFR